MAESWRSRIQVDLFFDFIQIFFLFDTLRLTVQYILNYCRTYTYNDRRYGHYQPNGYGQQYPGQKLPGQYPDGVPLGEDKFKFDPVSLTK